MKYDVIIVGAGLTGLSTAFFLKEKGFKPLVLEKNNRVGGAIQSHQENGFVYEEGPNTGVIGNPEVAELFEKLGIEPEIANADAEKRLILKNNKWYPLPSGAVGFFMTPLFRFSDKIKIMFEPFQKRGTDPDESVSALAARRIGQSFVDYAVNPFISGIYAGDPDKLITRYALPKLYQLEQKYGSFIGGSMKKAKELKTEREKKATRKVFSGIGGFSSLIEALEKNIGKENIICGAKSIRVDKVDNSYKVSYLKDDVSFVLGTERLISTVGAHALPDIFSFIPPKDMGSVSNLNYAKVIQVAVGVDGSTINNDYISFGGLIPQKEHKRLLGVLFPSFCFANRSPDGFVTLAIYLGGTRHPEYIDLSDEEIEKMIIEELNNLFQIPSSAIRFMKIFRHPYAIPQYEISSGERFEAVKRIEKANTGLIIAGNLRDGIGIADRIKQAYNIAENIS
ncbi:MAG: protoporphyrinogen oxidase [Dysgonomonas sp.]|nr:protoporphyrinogen oxidase [Dysgonomonas sp.]